jgi:type VI secretion system protein ImpK
MTSAPNLAFSYQEILTVVARLRSSESGLPDSAVFRAQIRRAVEQSETIAQSLGYSAEDIRLASFAIIALLDETILTSPNPAFAEWAQEPMTLELYGTANASESFFEEMAALMKRTDDSNSTIDLLEVYVLCLALGFRGHYCLGSEEQLRILRDPIVDRIFRARRVMDRVELSRSWILEDYGEAPAPSSRLTRLAFGTCVAVLVAGLVLSIGYHFVLSRGIGELAGIALR